MMPVRFDGAYCVLVSSIHLVAVSTTDVKNLQLEIRDDRCPSSVGDVWSIGHDQNAQSCIWHHKGCEFFTQVNIGRKIMPNYNYFRCCAICDSI
jgi:hypothetical protein